MMDEKALLEQWDMLIRCAISGKSHPTKLAVDLTYDSRNFLLSVAAEIRAMLEFQSRNLPCALGRLTPEESPAESEQDSSGDKQQSTASNIE